MEISKKVESATPSEATPARLLSLSLRMLRIYQISDVISGNLIFLMVIFSPWALGTTQPWSIWTMNTMAFTLSLLLGLKLAIRYFTGYQNPRWDVRDRNEESRRHHRLAPLLTRLLVILTVLIVAYCFMSAFNARSKYVASEARFEYFKFVSWLPHSFDQQSSWRAFWNYLALGLSFWAIKDWLVGKSAAEERAERAKFVDASERRVSLLPERLRRLLWVVSINGGLLAIEGLLQRMDGTAKLLFITPTRINQQAESQFGPYAYRSNAAQYFNLIWPVCLGFWWTLQRAAKAGFQRTKKWSLASHHVILIAVMLMAACPIVSTTRAGAFVAVVNLIAAAVILWTAQRKGDVKSRLIIVCLLALVLGFSALLGWEKLMPRLEKGSLEDGMAGRNDTYELARPMAKDYPLFGTGPGTFTALFQLYRIDPNEYWPAQLHNDWLETLITFGWCGSILIGLSLCLVLLRWFVPGGIHAGTRMVTLFWIAIAGCLLHARYDFPFQIYSIVFIFLVICAILFSVSRRTAR